MAVTHEVRVAYSSTGARWQEGPAQVYDRMAEVLLERCPVPVSGASVADVGAGTGAGGRAARRAGAASVVALDVAVGMLLADPDCPPAVVADARAIPARSGSFDVAVAAFSLNHLSDPATGLAELARVLHPGGGLVASAYASDDTHPVKAAVEEVLRGRGWRPREWVGWVRDRTMPLLATVDGARAVAASAGLAATVVEHHRVRIPGMTAADMVGWRLGLAQHAPFVASLGPSAGADVVAEAVALLGVDPPPLVRSVIVLTAVV